MNIHTWVSIHYHNHLQAGYHIDCTLQWQTYIPQDIAYYSIIFCQWRIMTDDVWRGQFFIKAVGRQAHVHRESLPPVKSFICMALSRDTPVWVSKPLVTIWLSAIKHGCTQALTKGSKSPPQKCGDKAYHKLKILHHNFILTSRKSSDCLWTLNDHKSNHV